MKRNSLTAIIGITQVLSIRAMNDTILIPGPEGDEKYHRYLARIRRAAVNEIIRLDSSLAPSSDLAKPMPGAASAFDKIADVLANTPGSGYEFLKDRK